MSGVEIGHFEGWVLDMAMVPPGTVDQGTGPESGSCFGVEPMTNCDEKLILTTNLDPIYDN